MTLYSRTMAAMALERLRSKREQGMEDSEMGVQRIPQPAIPAAGFGVECGHRAEDPFNKS